MYFYRLAVNKNCSKKIFRRLASNLMFPHF